MAVNLTADKSGPVVEQQLPVEKKKKKTAQWGHSGGLPRDFSHLF